METYGGLLFLLLLAAGNVALMIVLTQFLGPKRMGSRGEMYEAPYECGFEPIKVVRGHISVKFFVVALLFILFDVELIFLVPWAVIYRDLGLFGFVEMFIFLLVVVAGLFYSVKKGALEWE